jgi:alpha-L-fucosidase
MMQPWFEQAKFGIFVHWGAYAVGRRGKESWPIARAGVAYDEYIAEMAQFDAAAYDPDAWAELFRQAGAQYAVLTTKHHDGVTLWPTLEDSPSLASQCGDLVGPFCQSMRRAGLHTGLYFSHTDWSHLPHVQALSGKTAEEIVALRQEPAHWAELIGGLDDLDHDPRSPRLNSYTRDQWKEFLRFHRSQIKELLTTYAPVDLIWFDVMWGQGFFDYECAELREFIHSHSAQTVINSRMDGHGDYETPEQFIPVHAPPGPWELCA